MTLTIFYDKDDVFTQDPDILQTVLRAQVSFIENDANSTYPYIKLNSKTIFVGGTSQYWKDTGRLLWYLYFHLTLEFDPCLDPFIENCSVNALCMGNTTTQTFICECRAGFDDQSPMPDFPGRICALSGKYNTINTLFKSLDVSNTNLIHSSTRWYPTCTYIDHFGIAYVAYNPRPDIRSLPKNSNVSLYFEGITLNDRKCFAFRQGTYSPKDQEANANNQV